MGAGSRRRRKIWVNAGLSLSITTRNLSLLTGSNTTCANREAYSITNGFISWEGQQSSKREYWAAAFGPKRFNHMKRDQERMAQQVAGPWNVVAFTISQRPCRSRAISERICVINEVRNVASALLAGIEVQMNYLITSHSR